MFLSHRIFPDVYGSLLCKTYIATHNLLYASNCFKINAHKNIKWTLIWWVSVLLFPFYWWRICYRKMKYFAQNHKVGFELRTLGWQSQSPWLWGSCHGSKAKVQDLLVNFSPHATLWGFFSASLSSKFYGNQILIMEVRGVAALGGASIWVATFICMVSQSPFRGSHWSYYSVQDLPFATCFASDENRCWYTSPSFTSGVGHHPGCPICLATSSFFPSP